MEREAEKFISDLKKDFETKLQSVKTQLQLEIRRTDEKIIEIETNLEGGKNLEPLTIGGCIFFADSENSLGELDNDEPQTLPYGPFFLRVPYEDFQTYLHKDFQGDGFTYQLKPNYQFIEAEEKIYRLAQIYKTPFKIYSPYARRAVDIRIEGKSPEDFTQLEDLNFRLEQNNLADKLLMNKNFYWNVKIDSADYWQKHSADLYEHVFEGGIDDETYILPTGDATFDDEIEVVRYEEKIILKSPRAFYDDYCERVKILPLENKIAARIFSKPRLRTQGDIEFILSGFKRENYSCRFWKFGRVENPIKRYVKEHRCTSIDENFLRTKMKLPICSVRFSGDEIFLTDYANYVLNFLEERYPEFNWAGERDE